MSLLVASMAEKHKIPLSPGRVGVGRVVDVIYQRNDMVMFIRYPFDLPTCGTVEINPAVFALPPSALQEHSDCRLWPEDNPVLLDAL